MKCVMIIDDKFPIGITANIAASLGISLSGRINGLTGKDIEDIDGRTHLGITNIPIPILTASSDNIKDLYDELLLENDPGIHVIGFNNIAQKSQNYDEYEKKLSITATSEIELPGVCLYGIKKKVNKLTGNFKILK
jgi:hypothetical protein